MNWTELLNENMTSAYHATEGLVALVDRDGLDWKPATGENWMTTGQLLRHIADACGFCCRGFATGDWGLPEGADASEMSLEEMLPPAERMPTVETLDEAKALLGADRELALAMVAECGEDRMAADLVAAPWDPTPQLLGRRFLQMVGHLEQHKTQLFYYLKLQGKPVNTATLWGM